MKEANGKILKWVALYILPLIVVVGAVLTTFFTSQASQNGKIGVLEVHKTQLEKSVSELKSGLQQVDSKVDRIDKEVASMSVMQTSMKEDLKEIKELVKELR